MLLRCLLLLLATSAWADESPTPPELRWSKAPNTLRLRVIPAADSHLTAQLPVEATIDDGGAFRVEWSEVEVPEDGPMTLVIPRVRYADSKGWTVAAQGGVCNEGGSLCVPWHAEFDVPKNRGHGRIQTERGRLPSSAPPPVAKERPPKHRWHKATDELAVTAAFGEAEETGKPLLIDFFAVWCPPCDRLRDEFLHDPMQAARLDRFVLLKADADDPASFGLKNRYRVGGYPTVLIVRPDGELLERITGYAGAEAFGARLDAVQSADDAALLERLAAAIPGSKTQADLSITLARRRLAEDEKAAAWALLAPLQPLSEHLEGADLIAALTLAVSFDLDGHQEQALAAARVDPAAFVSLIDTLSGLLIKGDREPESNALLDEWHGRLADLPWGDSTDVEDGVLGTVTGRDAHEHERLAEVGYYRALWSDDPMAGFSVAALHFAAFCLLDGGAAPAGETFTVSTGALLKEGWLARNEGRVHDLLTLLEKAMRYPDAERFYPPMVALHPDAFTWHYRLAGHFIKRGGWEEAEVSAERARGYAYGDNRLRATARLVEILLETGRGAEALPLLDAELNTDAPAQEHVRTHRYRRKLEGLRQRALQQTGPR